MRRILIGATTMLVALAFAGPRVNLIQGYSFDPLAGVPELPEELTVQGYDGEYGYFLIQFSGPIEQGWREQAERAGAELLWYLPQYTYVARAASDKAAGLERLPGVRWVGLYQPAYKLFPGIEQTYGPQDLIVVLHKAEDGGRLLEQLAELGAYDLLPEFNRWNNSVRLTVDAGRIVDIARLAGVFWVEPYGEITPDNRDIQWVDQRGYHPSDTTRVIWHKGVTGSRVYCGLTDSQLWMNHDAFRDTSGNTPGPAHRKVIHYFGTQGANSHGTHTGGTVCGNDDYVGGSSLHDGLAKEAKLYFQFYTAFPTGWDMNVWFQGPDSGVAGMRVLNHSMSLSRKDTYNIYVFSDMTADQFVWNHRQFMHCNSMGNYGMNRMGHPVIAKSIISTGSTENGTSCRTLSDFTSRGPTADGRRKPQLVSPGSDIYSASSSNPSGYVTMSGTSMATPNMTASTALIRDYFRRGYYPTGDTTTGMPMEISAALNKAVAIVGAANDVSGFTVPDNNVGWGRIYLDGSLYFAGDSSMLWVADDTVGLETGDSAVFPVEVTDGAQPFRVTLCWSDYPGTMQAPVILVNDLNLTVVSPTGTEYKGNVWSGGQSQTGGIYDTLNVEECFRLDAPETGVWTVKVHALNVPFGPQPFALAAVGGFGAGPEHDVGVLRILAPVNQVDSGVVVTPRALVRNFGSSDESFMTRLTIGSVYEDSQPVRLLAGETDTVAFTDWIAHPVGLHNTACTTMLAVDENPANDLAEGRVEVLPLTGIEEGVGLPRAFSLERGVPTPFGHRTVVRYGLPRPASVELAVYSASGQLVRALATGVRPAGYHAATWDGRDQAGRQVSRGIYYTRLTADRFTAVQKLVKAE